MKLQDKPSRNKNQALLALSLELGLSADIDTAIDKALKSLAQIYNCKSDLCLADTSFEPIKNSALLDLKLSGTSCAQILLTRSRAFSSSDQKTLELFAEIVSQRLTELQLQHDLQISNEKLLRESKAKSQILSAVSHELRTPLTKIIGFSELILSKKLYKDEAKDYQSEILSSAKRLSNLIQDFLDLSRIESEQYFSLEELQAAEFDFLAHNAWQEAVAQVPLGTKIPEIRWSLDKALPRVYIDADAITRVFTNLFSNAIKYGEAQPITCEISFANDLVQVKVKDEGIGLAEEALETIFQRFYRVDSEATSHISGTGLGLWVCKQIITAHGGSIYCRSELGKGSEFIFELPLKENDVDA